LKGDGRIHVGQRIISLELQLEQLGHKFKVSESKQEFAIKNQLEVGSTLILLFVTDPKVQREYIDEEASGECGRQVCASTRRKGKTSRN
jgi:hypothetical protein